MPEAHGSGVVLRSLAHATYQAHLSPLGCLTPTKLRVTVRWGVSQKHGQVAGNWVRHRSRAGVEPPRPEPDSPGSKLHCACPGRKSLSFQNQRPLRTFSEHAHSLGFQEYAGAFQSPLWTAHSPTFPFKLF